MYNVGVINPPSNTRNKLVINKFIHLPHFTYYDRPYPYYNHSWTLFLDPIGVNVNETIVVQIYPIINNESIVQCTYQLRETE